MNEDVEDRIIETTRRAKVMMAWNGKFGKESNIVYKSNGDKTWKQGEPRWNWLHCDYKVIEEGIIPLTSEQIKELIGKFFILPLEFSEQEIVGFFSLRDGSLYVVYRSKYDGGIKYASATFFADKRTKTTTGEKLYSTQTVF